MNAFQQFFFDLSADHPRWNFIFFYDPVQTDRVLTGLWVTVQLSVTCVILSVVIGLAGAWLQGASSRLVRSLVQGYIQFFRNTPPLIQLLFFYFALGQFTPTYSPDGWLEIPIISNVGWAIISLAFTRRQILWQIILPQCFKRMIPPWMNWYAILTMATPLVSLLGVEELVTLSRQAMEAEDNHPELLLPYFGFALVIFFLYCYPIARWTLRLERKFAVKQ